MKNLGLMAFLTSLAIQSAGASNRGFCVPDGKELSLENAIVTVIAGQMDDGYQVLHPSDHQFFDPQPSSTTELVASDWGGDMRLQKTGTINGNVIAAIYENHMHGYDVPQQRVNCVASRYSPKPVDCGYLHCPNGYARPGWAGRCECFPQRRRPQKAAE